MGPWIGLGVFAAVLAVLLGVCLAVRRSLRRFSREVFGTADLLEGLKAVDAAAQQEPRSLNGCDSLLLPRILKDFPDFDANLAKTYCREQLQRKLGHRDGFTIHRIVISKYLSSLSQKTVVMQAAVAWLEDGQRLQKRFDLDYTYLLDPHRQSVAANCPNCGGALGFGQVECPFCGSRVANVLKNTWCFTAMRES